MKAIFAIFCKELIDAVRDRRTILVVLLSALLGVPLTLFAMSEILTQIQDQDEKRTLVVANMQAAPSLENYLLRQSYVIKPAPFDYEKKLHSKDITQPVLVIPKDFEEKLAARERPRVEMVSDTANQQSQIGLRQLRGVLDGFNHHTVMLDLMMRGVSPDVLQAIEVKEHYVSRGEDRKLSLTSILPFLLMTAVVVGGIYAAIDTMAGERERGSLEPLLMNPVSGWQMALGKWAAVATVSMTVVIFTVLSFFPSQWLIRNEVLRAEFQFGWREALGFIVALLPLAAGISAVQIAVALSCKTYKEAQARNQILMLGLTLLPLFAALNPGREPQWFQWVPMLAQTLMMNHVLKGESPEYVSIAVACAVCLSLVLASLYFVAHKMRRAVMS